MAIKALATRIRTVGSQSVDTSLVQRELEALLDKSIQAGEYIVTNYNKNKLVDLSKLDANALHDFFFKIENKNLLAEQMQVELEEKIKEMARRNKKRLRFLERLDKLIKEYNTGSHDIEHLISNLVELAKDLTEEENRNVRENLNEEELAVFDILVKENLNPDEREQVKKAAKEMIEKLKAEKLTPHWRDFEPTRSGVKTTISDYIYTMPEPTYTEIECQKLIPSIYNFIYELAMV